MGMTAAAYLEQLQALLPRGVAWPRNPDAEMTRVLAALAEEFARVDARGDTLLIESDPSQTVEMLADWERNYLSPLASGASYGQRIAWLVHKVTTPGSILKPYFVSLATALGFTIRIEDYRSPIIGFFAVGDELVWEPWQDLSAGVSGAGDTLGGEALPAILPACWQVFVIPPLPDGIPTALLESTLNDLGPAHIQMNFIYL